MDDFIRVGVITSTHGIKGEVKVYPTTDDINRFEHLKQVYLDLGREYKPLNIEHVKYYKQLVILKFEGMDNINDIEKYKGRDLLITRDQAIGLKENEYFIFDLIDSEVYTEEGLKLGIVSEVITTAANDVLVVKASNDKEILLPFINDCVLDVDTADKRITVHLMSGLM
ncbi:MAG: ribosome maturation factor RimM [Clostridiales bacterium]|jgi:16S rRNA processing protein RimM|nr:ribosome maturation factor RimM [Clostridiales bacterium]